MVMMMMVAMMQGDAPEALRFNSAQQSSTPTMSYPASRSPFDTTASALALMMSSVTCVVWRANEDCSTPVSKSDSEFGSQLNAATPHQHRPLWRGGLDDATATTTTGAHRTSISFPVGPAHWWREGQPVPQSFCHTAVRYCDSHCQSSGGCCC